MSDIVQRWVQQALYDFQTARAMQQTGRYLYVLFCCQQAVEKTLKGLIAKNTGEFPPRIHQLVRLAEVAGLSLPSEHADFLRELSAYYIQTRYPEELADTAAEITAEIAGRVLESSEREIQWLHSML